jgi:hypothetical protein
MLSVRAQSTSATVGRYVFYLSFPSLSESILRRRRTSVRKERRASLETLGDAGSTALQRVSSGELDEEHGAN